MSLHNTILQIARGDMSLSEDIDEHLSKEEANNLAEKKREEWIEEGLEETMKDREVIATFLQDECDEIAAILTGRQTTNLKIKEFNVKCEKYCREHLEREWETNEWVSRLFI